MNWSGFLRAVGKAVVHRTAINHMPVLRSDDKYVGRAIRAKCFADELRFVDQNRQIVAEVFRFVFAAALAVSVMAFVALVLMEERRLGGPATKDPPSITPPPTE